jgi:hypothetical protein
MKLYEVPKNTVVIFLGEKLFFDHLDGMYSFCLDEKGNVVHLSAYTDVEISEDQNFYWGSWA